jgi:hypothetical protein
VAVNVFRAPIQRLISKLAYEDVGAGQQVRGDLLLIKAPQGVIRVPDGYGQREDGAGEEIEVDAPQ